MSQRLITGICVLGLLASPGVAHSQGTSLAAKEPGTRAGIDACAMLKAGQIHAVQGDRVTRKQSSRTPSGAFLLLQCFYQTARFSNSVSLALATPDPDQPGHSGAREYWREKFHREPEKEQYPGGESGEDGEKPETLRAVTGIGEEAFWVGNPINGALYVLQGDFFLRISVGGPGDESSKIKKAARLARHALQQLRPLPRRNGE